MSNGGVDAAARILSSLPFALSRPRSRRSRPTICYAAFAWHERSGIHAQYQLRGEI